MPTKSERGEISPRFLRGSQAPKGGRAIARTEMRGGDALIGAPRQYRPAAVKPVLRSETFPEVFANRADDIVGRIQEAWKNPPLPERPPRRDLREVPATSSRMKRGYISPEETPGRGRQMSQSITLRLAVNDLESRLALSLAARDDEASLRVTLEGVPVTYSLAGDLLTLHFAADAAGRVEQV